MPGTMAGMAYEYRAVRIPPGTDRRQAKDILQIHAEYGGWELTLHRIWADGRREVTVRRRVTSESLPPLPT